jgi:alkylresorcinol/alkylpyrone synthase
MTQIMAVRSAFPPYRYSQDEVASRIAEFSALNPYRRALLERMHANSGVSTRYTVLPLSEYGRTGGVELVLLLRW